MNKEKLKRLMDERNPAKRVIVKPVNLYGSKTVNQQDNKTTKPQVVKYTTHLKPDTVKTIKIFSVHNNIKDYQVVQEALEKYFSSKKD